MKSNRFRRIVTGLAAAALLLLLGASARIARADPFGSASGTLHRLVADYQNSTSLGPTGEISTDVKPGALGTGGTNTYSKSVAIPDNTVFITFSAQGDSHLGSALLMRASVTDSTGAVTQCQPLAGQTDIGGGGSHLQTGWYTLLHLPEPATATSSTQCNDGGGGTADCHDNTLYFSCCAQVKPDSTDDDGDAPKPPKGGGGPTTHKVNIFLANSDGALAFYERSTIYIDSASSSRSNPLCTGVGQPTPTPTP